MQRDLWLEELLNLAPYPILLGEMGTAKPIFVNASGMRYVHPKEEGPDIAKNAATMTDEEVRVWQNGWADSTGHPLPPEEAPGRRAARGEIFSNYELIWHNLLTGRSYNVLANGTVLPPSHGHPELALLNFIDLTPFVRQREQLRIAVNIRDDFLQVAAHELRTPVASALLQTQTLIRKEEKTPLPHHDLLRRLHAVEKSLVRLRDLEDDLLNVSMIHSPKALKLEAIDLGHFVHDVAEHHREEAVQKQCRMRVRCPMGAVRGLWDKRKLERILTNLVTNAIKYGPLKPIDIEVSVTDGHATVRVRDHGIGVPPSDRERIFARYERAAPTDQYGGFGLGLWISKQAAESMQGDLWVEDPSVGEGSVFVLKLPLYLAEV